MELTIKKLNTIKFVWRAANDLIGHRGVRNEIPLPIKIGDFELVRPILEDKKNNKFQYGIYKNSAGKEYVAKQLSLRDPGIDEYWLRNEISVYSALTSLYDQKGDVIHKEFPNIKIPRLAYVAEDGVRLMFLIEKITGRTLFDFPMNIRVECVEEAIRYFRFINSIHDFKNRVITNRSFGHMLITLFVASLGAFGKHPSQWLKITKGTAMIIINLPFLIIQREKELIHRDIGYSNILIGENNEKYIIDFELSSYMHPMWEVVQVVLGCWKRGGFKDAFSQSEVMSQILNDTKLKKLYKLLSIYSGIHLLSTHDNKNISEYKTSNVKGYFNYALNI